MEGRCQCGTIKFTTPLTAPLKVFVCHCTQCRHQSSSSYGVTARFPDFDIAPPSPGTIAVYSRPNSNGRTDGYFCTKCGARLIHKKVTPEGEVRGAVSIKAGCLEGLSKEMMRKAVHIWTKEAVVDIPEGVESHAEGPPA